MGRMMKDSGIEWIGEIPFDWSIVKIKNLADASCENSFIDGDWIESQDISDEGIRYLTTGNVGDGVFKRQGNSYVSEETFSRLNCKYAYPKDLVYARLNAPYGRTCILPNDNEKYVLAVDIVILRTKNDSRFLCYVSQCDGYQRMVEDNAKGTTMKRISRTNLGRILIPLPPIIEQARIANFLDKKCSEIDSVIEKTEKTIEEYKALKQSIITEAVTKGIRGDRPMKDSGIEWIGKIPEEWTVKIAFQLFKQVKNKNENMQEKNLLSLSYGKIKRKNIETLGGLLPESFDGYNIIEADDIVLRLTDLQNDHTSLRVGLSHEKGIVTSAYLTLRNQSANTSLYLYYYLHSFDINKGFYGMGAGVRQGLNWDGIKLLRISLPSLEEQKEITNFLDKKCADIDELINTKQQLLSDLDLYKKSLIYEYVTGKKEAPICQ